MNYSIFNKTNTFILIFVLFLVSIFYLPTTASAIYCGLPTKQAYKTNTDSAIYYITSECTKRPFKNSIIFYTYFNSFSDVKITTDSILNIIPNDKLGFMPWGPKYDPKFGALVKIPSDPKVYILLNSKKYWIKSENIFNTLLYPWSWIEDVDADLLNKYTEAGEINYIDHHPEFTIIKYKNSNKVYRLEYNQDGVLVKNHIKDEITFEKLQYRWDRILTINDSEVYPDSESSTPVIPSPTFSQVVDNSIGLITNKIIEITLDGKVDLNFVMNTNNWNIISDTDLNFKNYIHPSQISRFTTVLDADDRDYNGQNQADVVVRNTFYLILPTELNNDEKYVVSLVSPNGNKYIYDGTNGVFSNKNFSSWNLIPGKGMQSVKAIKINQYGYSLASGERYAYVGYWLGSGGTLNLPNQLSYIVYDVSTKQIVKTGTSKNLGLDNLSGEILHRLDLDNLPEGKYYIEISGIGRSFVFRVGGDTAFTAFYTAIRGLYHQRAGMALNSNYTYWDHLICMNKVYKTDVLENFGDKFPVNTSKANPINISGGWFDAGDFDLRPMHLIIVEDLITLQEMFPNKFTDNQLNLPESGNDIPDVLDEALWGLKLWENLQEPDGGVRAGVESYAHPGSSSCVGDTLPYWTYAPNRWTSYKFAGSAAHMARILANYPAGIDKANALKLKALLAWNWAEAQTNLGTTAPVDRTEEDKKDELEREKMYAAGELFALTDETKYQNIFKSLYPNYRGPTWSTNVYSFWGYANAKGTNVDKVFQTEVKNRLVGIGNEELEKLVDNNYKNSTNFNYAIAWGSGSNSMRNTVATIMAYYFSPEQKYIDAISLNADYQLGENPLGLSWITGLGIFNPEFPLHLNSMYDDQIKPVPGLPIYGPHARDYNGDCMPVDSWLCLVYNNFYPTPKNIPELRQYAQWSRMADMNEFTVWQDMAYTSLGYGFLYAISSENKTDVQSINPDNYPLNGGVL